MIIRVQFERQKRKQMSSNKQRMLFAFSLHKIRFLKYHFQETNVRSQLNTHTETTESQSSSGSFFCQKHASPQLRSSVFQPIPFNFPKYY